MRIAKQSELEQYLYEYPRLTDLQKDQLNDSFIGNTDLNKLEMLMDMVMGDLEFVVQKEIDDLKQLDGLEF